MVSAAEYYSQSKWRGTLAMDGGGALINQAVHTPVVGDGDVSHVRARAATAIHAIEGEDTAIALLEFASGALGLLQATTSAFPGYPRRLEITGTEGTVILEQDRIIAVDLRNAPAGVSAGTPSEDKENTSSPVVSDFTGHQAIFEDLFEPSRRMARQRVTVTKGGEASYSSRKFIVPPGQE